MPEDKPIGPIPIPRDDQPTLCRHTGFDGALAFIEHGAIHERLLGDAVLFDDCIINKTTKSPWRPLTSAELADVIAVQTTSLRQMKTGDSNELYIKYLLDLERCAFATISYRADIHKGFTAPMIGLEQISTYEGQALALYPPLIKLVLLDEGIQRVISEMDIGANWANIFRYFSWKGDNVVNAAWNVTGEQHWKRVLREMLILAAKEPRIEQWDKYESLDDAVLNHHCWDLACKYIRIITDKEFAPLLQTGKAFFNVAALDPKKLPSTKLSLDNFRADLDPFWENVGTENALAETMPIEYLDEDDRTYIQLKGYKINNTLIAANTLHEYLDAFPNTYHTHQSVIDDARENYGICEWEYNGSKFHVVIGKTLCSKCVNKTTNEVGNLKYAGATVVHGYDYNWYLGIDERIAIDYFFNSDQWNKAWKNMFKYRKHRSFSVVPESFKNQFDVAFEFYKTFNGYCDVEAPFPYVYDASYQSNLNAESVMLPDPYVDSEGSLDYKVEYDSSDLLDVNPITFMWSTLRRDAKRLHRLVFHSKSACTKRVLEHRARFWLRFMRDQSAKTGSEDIFRNWITKSQYVSLVDSVSHDIVAWMGTPYDVIRYTNIRAYYHSGYSTLWHAFGHQIVNVTPTVTQGQSDGGNIIVQAARPSMLKDRESAQFIKLAENEGMAKYLIDLFHGTASTQQPVKESKPAPVEKPAPSTPVVSETPSNNEDDDEA